MGKRTQNITKRKRNNPTTRVKKAKGQGNGTKNERALLEMKKTLCGDSERLSW